MARNNWWNIKWYTKSGTLDLYSFRFLQLSQDDGGIVLAMPSYLRVEREDEPCDVRSKSISRIAYIHSKSNFATDQDGTQKPQIATAMPQTHLSLVERKGWQRGKAGLKDGVFTPVLHDFVLPHPCLALHDGEIFFTPFPPLGAP